MPGPIPPFIRLLSGFTDDKKTGCWLWNGAKYRNGYGWIKAFGKGKLVHRLSYELHKGPIPDGLEVLHSCDTKLCINPAHLRAGTHAENMREAKERGLMASGENHPMFGKKWPDGIKNRLSKPVMVQGKLYASQKEAERHLGLGSGTVRYWINNRPDMARHITKEEYENGK